jgi:hypothetical protein
MEGSYHGNTIGFWSTYGWHPSSVDAAIATVGWL